MGVNYSFEVKNIAIWGPAFITTLFWPLDCTVPLSNTLSANYAEKMFDNTNNDLLIWKALDRQGTGS